MIFKFLVTYIPPIRSKFQREISIEIKKIENEIVKDATDRTLILPEKGCSPDTIRNKIKGWYDRDEPKSTTGKISGSRYASGDKPLEDLIKDLSSKLCI